MFTKEHTDGALTFIGYEADNGSCYTFLIVRSDEKRVYAIRVAYGKHADAPHTVHWYTSSEEMDAEWTLLRNHPMAWLTKSILAQ